MLKTISVVNLIISIEVEDKNPNQNHGKIEVEDQDDKKLVQKNRKSQKVKSQKIAKFQNRSEPKKQKPPQLRI